VPIGKSLLTLGVLTLPLSYALKFIFNLPNMAWIDPSLIFFSLLFCLMFLTEPKKTINTREFIIFTTLFSLILFTTLLSIFYRPFDIPTPSVYHLLNIPIKLTLLFIMYFVVQQIVIEKNTRAVFLKTLAIVTILEFAIALLFFMSSLKLFHLPGSIGLYVVDFKARQSIYVGEYAFSRFGGTFTEAPVFGLFMFAAFIIFYLETHIKIKIKSGKLLNYACWIAFIGTIASCSTQILLALVFFMFFSDMFRKTRSRENLLLIFSMAMAVAIFLLLPQILNKLHQLTDATEVFKHSSTSFGERYYLAQFALTTLLQNPVLLLFGSGLGQFGVYFNYLSNGLRPDTVTPQITLIAWLFEMGVTGTLLISIFLANIFKRTSNIFGNDGRIALISLLIAIMFQANWFWEMFFITLAYISTNIPEQKPAMVPKYK
jgi:hypothetical protein